MYLSKDEFLQMQQQRQASRPQNGESFQGPRVGFFGLKDNGDEAIVRIAVNPDEFEVYTVHPVTIDGKFRKVNCINDLKAGVHSCPLCEAGVQLQNKFYIRLIEYTRDENGNIVAQPKVWERPTSYIQRLMNLYTEYGSLKDNVFKIKRRGERGSMQTDYEFLFANPQIYNEQLYPKDFSAFEGYTPLGGAIINKNAEELKTLAAEMGLTPQMNEVYTQPVQQFNTTTAVNNPVNSVQVVSTGVPVGTTQTTTFMDQTQQAPVRRVATYN